MQLIAGSVDNRYFDGMSTTGDIWKDGLIGGAWLTLGLSVEKILQPVAGGFVESGMQRQLSPLHHRYCRAGFHRVLA